MVEFTFRGLMAPVFTPFNRDMSINLKIVRDYAHYLWHSGINGVLVNGTTGEGMSLNVQERKQITEEWIKAVKETGQHLMVQVGGAPLPDVLELTKHAEQVGVNSILCLPELYFKPFNIDDLADYLKIVGKAAPKTPLLYYHIPSFTNVNINMGEFLNNYAKKIENFQGIKFTSPNLDEGTAALNATNREFAVFLGADQLMAGAYVLGFDSAIATTLNIFPDIGSKILNAVKESNFEEARDSQFVLTSLCERITKYGGWVATMKQAMNLYSPITVGLCRDPLKNLKQNEIEEMQNSLKIFNL